MEDVVTVPTPVVTKSEVSESVSENKVEQISNGTVATAMNSEKIVSQSVQSSGDQVIVQKR
jgi:hypothetical protein